MKAYTDLPLVVETKLTELEAAVPVLKNEDGTVKPVVTQDDLDERTLQIIQQPSLPPKQDWPMGNNPLFKRVRALESGQAEAAAQLLVVRDAQQIQIDAVREAIARQDPQLALLTTELQEQKATLQAEQVKLAANTLADQAQDAWLALVDAEGKETKALALLNKQEAAANKAALLAATLKATAQQAQLDAQALAIQAAQAKADAAQSTGTAALAAAATAQAKADAAQTKADAADAKAQVAQGKADAATAKAEAAKTAADTATTKADTAQATAATAATNAVNALTNAAAAQTTATNAQNDLNAFRARFRAGTTATPAITIQVATPSTVTVNFTPAFADINYRVVISKTSAGLLPLDISAVAKTTSSFTLTLRNTGALSLAVPAGTVDYIILHD